MDYEKERYAIEVIKMTMGTLSYLGKSVKEVNVDAINLLNFCHMQGGEICYLEAALYHIKAYMEMGYEYEMYKEMFDYVIDNLNVDYAELIRKNNFNPIKVKLTKQQIKNMIVKWPASKQRISIDDVALDIISKIENREIGVHFYNSNSYEEGENQWKGDLYELVISEDDAYFHDIKRKRYFIFEL